jgi:hypothetical protein
MRAPLWQLGVASAVSAHLVPPAIFCEFCHLSSWRVLTFSLPPCGHQEGIRSERSVLASTRFGPRRFDCGPAITVVRRGILGTSRSSERPELLVAPLGRSQRVPCGCDGAPAGSRGPRGHMRSTGATVGLRQGRWFAIYQASNYLRGSSTGARGDLGSGPW